jgi:hypothetical protein
MEITIEENMLFYEHGATINLTPITQRILTNPERWNVTDIQVNGGSIWSITNDCVKDNYLEFYPNGSFEYFEGSNVCSPSSNGMGLVNGFNQITFPIQNTQDFFIPSVSSTFSGAYCVLNSSADFFTMDYYDNQSNSNVRYTFSRVD